MEFEIDEQTLADLALFREENGQTVFSIFNTTSTRGGRNKLDDLLRNPSGDIGFLTAQRDVIRFFFDQQIELKLMGERIEMIEHYMNLTIPPLHNNFIDATYNSLSYKLKPTNNHYLIQAGIEELLLLLRMMAEKLKLLEEKELPERLAALIVQGAGIFEHKKVRQLMSTKKKQSFYGLHRYDHLFRGREKHLTEAFLDLVYTFDAYEAVARAARKHHFTFPEYSTSRQPAVDLQALFHPLVRNAVANDIGLVPPHRLCFLTGPNMAGKSTFLKALGISVYLAHTGFPVPAKYMRTTVFRGVMTTINLPDSIHRGYSHYYNEVKRVKDTALKIQEKKNMFIIFDELFRGTNVKDAHDASLLIISMLAGISTALFFISTHITEIADQLNNSPHILFKYFDAWPEGSRLKCSYQLKDGVSVEKAGMLIIRNEQIITILEKIIKEQHDADETSN